jgi:hypothetical protein
MNCAHFSSSTDNSSSSINQLLPIPTPPFLPKLTRIENKFGSYVPEMKRILIELGANSMGDLSLVTQEVQLKMNLATLPLPEKSTHSLTTGSGRDRTPHTSCEAPFEAAWQGLHSTAHR